MKQFLSLSYLPFLFTLLAGVGCGMAPQPDDTLFERLSVRETGVSFTNELPEDTTFNILNYLYYYNGGGVAAADVNNDGLVDLYFTSNLDSNRLYLNQGDFRFTDVTERAGVGGSGNWSTGVTMADVNGDGHLDIYVAGVGGYLDRNGRNQLFINRGDGTFKEEAAAYGLDFTGYGTHASFFDYDLDGNLDVYLLNHSTHRERTYDRAAIRNERHPTAGDRLYRNDDGRFKDVSAEAGIYGGRIGYGLSAAVSDLDGNGCPDIYVANDFHEDDYLYFNQCDGTFVEGLREAVGHISQAAMGTDAADFNNDGRPDLIVLDMLPTREDVLKTSASIQDDHIYELKRSYGYYHQYARNTLQLNLGGRRFSEIGYLAGIEATDWSWAALFADLDNDGWKDLFVTNGIYRRPDDLDYIEVASRDEVQASLALGVTAEDLKLLEMMPQVRIPNYAFRNNGDLTFTSRAPSWGLDDSGFSNGAAYADLDNDGDLDLVVNNIGEPATIYRNRSERFVDRHYLSVDLVGASANTDGIGAKVTLRYDGRMQVQELFPSRGFQSAVDPRLHFGLGAAAVVDSLTVVWPGGAVQTLTGVAADQKVTLHEAEASERAPAEPERRDVPLFEDVTGDFTSLYRHEENKGFSDFVLQPLMPHKLSMEGPALAVADVNGDGLEDIFAGGGKRQSARLLIQQRDGRFRPSSDSLWQSEALGEDVDAAFFDADGDGDQDLFVVRGGNEFWGRANALRDGLFLNDGTGRFTKGTLPDYFENGGCVAPEDVDGDGDVDLFVGTRVIARRYGEAPDSYLLENDGSGRFTDVTAMKADVLSKLGMVTDAVWADIDGDGRPELVVVGEWMPVRVFSQEEGQFVEKTEAAGLAETTGWWNAVIAEDMDGDGDIDLVGGNLGLNSRIRGSVDRPARLYVKDFDGNGRLNPILTTFRDGADYPIAGAEMLLGAVYTLRERYRSFTDFGAKRVEDLFSMEEMDGVRVLTAGMFASVYLENSGNGTFTVHTLPVEAQFAPIYALLADDFDRDGQKDLVTAGNFSGVAPLRGRYDASYGLLLRGHDGGLAAVEHTLSGLWINGEVREMALMTRPDGTRAIVAARNDDRLKLIRISTPAL